MENTSASVVVNVATRSLTALKLVMPQTAVFRVYDSDLMSSASCDELVVSVRFVYPECESFCEIFVWLWIYIHTRISS
jgi:hypothetical protein